MTARTLTAEQAAHRIGPRARSLRENVEIEAPEVNWYAPRFASVDTTVVVLESDLSIDPGLDDQSAARERSAQVDSRHRQAALVGRANQVRDQLARAWSSLD